MGEFFGTKVEALYSPASTNDNEDDGDVDCDSKSVSCSNDNGPETVYRDNPISSASNYDRYRDDPTKNDEEEGNIFDWGNSSSIAGSTLESTAYSDVASSDRNVSQNTFKDKRNKMKLLTFNHREKNCKMDTCEFDADVSFAPVNLHDVEDDSDCDNEIHKNVYSGIESNRGHKIFVGGGWGRHGSSNTCPIFLSSLMCYNTRRGNTRKDSSICRFACLTFAFTGLLFGFGILGYEAGQPLRNDDRIDKDNYDNENKNSTIFRPNTKGEEWLEWIEHPKEHVHLPPIHLPQLHNKDKSSEMSSIFAPMTKSQLFRTSQNIYHICSEPSILTVSGRNACLSACRGHICCFEKDVAYGSCVSEPNSYCFAYAACENAVRDFKMTNVNILPTNLNDPEMVGFSDNSLDYGSLTFEDINLLRDTCSMKNIATLEGIKDCNAFCQHHLCCFSEHSSENCSDQNPKECEDYLSCKILLNVKSSSGSDSDGDDEGAGNDISVTEDTNISNPTTSSNTANGHDFSYHDPDVIRSAVNAVCDVDPEKPHDESWISACRALCADYLCCFSTPGTQSNCLDLYGSIMCNAYSGCTALLHDDDRANDDLSSSQKYVPHRPEAQGLQVTPSDIREVNEACNDRVSWDGSLRTRCESACSSRKCCFSSGPGNCYILDTAWCDEFQACQVLS